MELPCEEVGLQSDTVDQLRDRWVDSKELTDEAGQVGELAECLVGWVADSCRQNFRSKLVLDRLADEAVSIGSGLRPDCKDYQGTRLT